MSLHTFVIVPNVKFYENPSNGIHADKYGHTDGRKDGLAKLTGTFRHS